jgi:hypothetical protein
MNAQNDIYGDNNGGVELISESDVVDIDDYSTEQDYNEKYNIEPIYEVSNEEIEEIYSNEKQPKRKRNTLAGEIAAEVVVEVIVNTIFIIATFWN